MCVSDVFVVRPFNQVKKGERVRASVWEGAEDSSSSSLLVLREIIMSRKKRGEVNEKKETLNAKKNNKSV